MGVFFIGSAETLLNFFEFISNKISSIGFATVLEGRPGYIEIIFYYLTLIIGLLIIKRLIKPKWFDRPTISVNNRKQWILVNFGV